MPHGGVDLHGVDPEGAVTSDADHLPAGERQCGGDGEGDADAKTAECAGVEIRRGLQPDPREAEKVAAVGDTNAVGRGHLPDRPEDRHRMDLAVLAGLRSRVIAPPFGPLPVLGPKAVSPRGVPPAGIDAKLLRQGRQGRPDRGEHFGRAATVVVQIAGRIRDAQETGVGKHAGGPVGELVVELPP